MSARLDGKAAFITGGASGIGAATARLFVEEGSHVVIADMDAARGQALASDLGPLAGFQPLDVTDEAGWAQAIEAASARLGRLDILVNSAGIGDGGTDIEHCSLEQWNRVLAINLTGTFLGCQNAVRAMKRFGNGGSIVNLSSVIGIRASAARAAYGSAKAAVQHLTKSVALYCGAAGYNIRCNAVHPGPTDTPILDYAVADFGGNRDAMLQALATSQALQRVGTAREVAAAILYLASDESSFVTATSLIVDGGYVELGLTRRPPPPKDENAALAS